MEVAFLVSASVRLAGKAKIVELEINKFINVCPVVRIMDITIWKLALAFATVIGPDMIAHKLFVVWIADQMEFVNPQDAVVTLDGLEHYVNNWLVTPAVLLTDNVKMELASVHKDGTENTARCVSFQTPLGNPYRKCSSIYNFWTFYSWLRKWMFTSRTMYIGWRRISLWLYRGMGRIRLFHSTRDEL